MNSTRFVQELRETGAALARFSANQSGSSAQIMGVTSVMAAGIFGLGILILGFGTNAPQQHASPDAEAARQLVAALNGDILSPELSTPTIETAAQTPTVAAFDTALQLALPSQLAPPSRAVDVQPDEDRPLTEEITDQEPVMELNRAAVITAPQMAPINNAASNTAPITAALDASLVGTGNAAAHEDVPALRSVSFSPIMDNEFRNALVNGTVDAFNRVLPTMEEAVVAIQSGDTMMDLLTDFGIDRTEAYYAIEAFGEVFNPRRIRAGQEFSLAYEVSPPMEQGSADDQFRLINLSMRTAADREVIVAWDEETEDFTSVARDIVLEERFTRGRGTIDSSLYLAANDMGVPDAMTINMIRIFSHSVDFQRDIRTGDDFDIFYSQHHDETGEAVMNGDVIFASMTTRGRERNLYRFTTTDDGDTDYYDENGQSVRAFLMRTPIDGARITSNFGNRRHPVLGYNRMHKGVDFGAPTGTPIYAAGNGTIVRASVYGSFGNYVRIRHANGYETAYAHMTGYGPGIRSGVRVEQGQIIGYVGATGRVTGAHLHYEVFMNGDQVNPRTIELPSGRALEGEMLTAFQQHRIEIDAQMAEAYTLGSGSASLDVSGDSAN